MRKRPRAWFVRVFEFGPICSYLPACLEGWALLLTGAGLIALLGWGSAVALTAGYGALADLGFFGCILGGFALFAIIHRKSEPW
jgi:hypothetical protein